MFVARLDFCFGRPGRPGGGAHFAMRSKRISGTVTGAGRCRCRAEEVAQSAFEGGHGESRRGRGQYDQHALERSDERCQGGRDRSVVKLSRPVMRDEARRGPIR